MEKSITVFAPATVANVGCAFDILGFAVCQPGDTVTLKLKEQPGVEIAEIEGDQKRLPKQPDLNTAGVALLALINQLKQPVGFSLKIKKGLPLGSGLGSSAASAAAAVFAGNYLLGEPFSLEQLIPFAMQAEKVACGQGHADNVAPALLGGFVLIRSYDPLDLVRIPTPPALYCTLVLPAIEIKTSSARKILKKEVPLTNAVKQWGNTAGLIAALFKQDYQLLARSLEDHVVEPERALLIPGFDAVKRAALQAGALGCGISGSGPALFALSKQASTAEEIAKAMQAAFFQIDISSQHFVSEINQNGAEIVKTG